MLILVSLAGRVVFAGTDTFAFAAAFGADNIVGSGNTRVSDVQAIIIDTDKDNNFGPNKGEDPNKTGTVDIVSLTLDTGYSNTDFITKDRTRGGHLLAAATNGVTVKLQHAPAVALGLPMTRSLWARWFRSRPVRCACWMWTFGGWTRW